MRWLLAADRTPAPWKNGGGLTWTIAADPAGADLADFRWRLSLARVESPGPFSRFDGVQRHLALVAGGPLVLCFADDQASVTITTASDAFTFSGERPATAELAGEAVTDLNFVVRQAGGALVRRSLNGPVRLGGGFGGCIVVSLGEVAVGQRALGPLDAVWLDPGEEALFAPSGEFLDIWLAVLPPVENDD